ncbi:unnamed protein product [Dibothriocephalus latus]|uniref:Uncharacterized protein n=1 Tax=Dibothriocephalus latus TaxID=60516 RepID=A0A3P7NZ00_DIBLA|nr:unnamed protein product [Dibothriocephalus latus]
MEITFCQNQAEEQLHARAYRKVTHCVLLGVGHDPKSRLDGRNYQSNVGAAIESGRFDSSWDLKDAADPRFQRVDRVQQYSEKRTRITATPDAYCRTENDRQFRCPANASPTQLPTLKSGTAPFSKSSTCNSFSEVDDFSDLDANSQRHDRTGIAKSSRTHRTSVMERVQDLVTGDLIREGKMR